MIPMAHGLCTYRHTNTAYNVHLSFFYLYFENVIGHKWDQNGIEVSFIRNFVEIQLMQLTSSRPGERKINLRWP